MIKLNKVHHIAIICSDYAVSKRFYIQVLGLEIVKETFRKERNYYKLDLALNGETIIELFSFDNPPERVSHPEAAGLRHLAFEVDIEEVIVNLNEKGVKTEQIRTDVLTNKRFTFFSR